MIDPAEVALIVVAKEPLPGRCKTRLCPPLAQAEAALLAEASLHDTLETVASMRARRRVLALDGAPGDWLPPGVDVIPQSGGGLGDRLAAAFADVGGPALLIGMDTPQVSVGALDAARFELANDVVDAVIGPALDGGYWAIGLREARPEAFAGVPMSSARTAAAQGARLRELGLRWTPLEPMRDFDTIDDARAVAALCPDSGFARALEALPWAVAA